MAIDIDTGELIDPHGGMGDLKLHILRFVGNPTDRIREDGLRVMRAFRFQVTKNLWPWGITNQCINDDFAAHMLSGASIERVREELERMLKHDTMASIVLFRKMQEHTLRAIFRDGLRLSATLKD